MLDGIFGYGFIPPTSTFLGAFPVLPFLGEQEARIKEIQIVLRPAPDLGALPSNSDRALVQAVDNIRRWCREAERAVHELETALNEVRAKLP